MHIIKPWNIALIAISVIFAGYSSGSLSDAYGQSDTELDVPDNIGIAPDNLFYFIDVAIDQLRLNIAATNSEKARIGLEIAEERLVEYMSMVNKNKVAEAETAVKEHDNILKDVTGRLASDDSGDENSTDEELSSTIEIEKRLAVHRLNIDEVKERVKERITINRDRLSENMNANLEQSLSGLSGALTRVDAKIAEEKTRIKEKFAEDFLKPNSEINSRIIQLEKVYQDRFEAKLLKSDKGN